jgi:hypothetical protein
MQHLRRILRFAAPAAVMFLLAAAQPDLATAARGAQKDSGNGGAGRDYARCIVGCNQARRECRQECKSTCRELFPGRDNRDERRACRQECRTSCGEQRQACRADCESLKPPISPGGGD